MSEPVLCLIKNDRAYFTSTTLDKQWGDDWNDAPYEHNAGDPYHNDKDDLPVDIVEVVFDSDFVSPCTGRTNSIYSVEQINQGITPWLRSPNTLQHIHIQIFAGCTLSLFIQYIKIGGGRIFTEK
jgi:hypothetical protein